MISSVYDYITQTWVHFAMYYNMPEHLFQNIMHTSCNNYKVNVYNNVLRQTLSHVSRYFICLSMDKHYIIR